MTGESLPVEKFPERRGDASGVLEQSNLVFMGTNVVSGAATALVVARILAEERMLAELPANAVIGL